MAALQRIPDIGRGTLAATCHVEPIKSVLLPKTDNPCSAGLCRFCCKSPGRPVGASALSPRLKYDSS
jgi:hypothetical protein